MFFIEGGNVLTKKNLQQIQDVEKRFLNDENFKGKVCRLTTTGDCVKPQSLLRFFDGTFAEVSPVFNDPDFNNISGVVYEANRWGQKTYVFHDKANPANLNSSPFTWGEIQIELNIAKQNKNT